MFILTRYSICLLVIAAFSVFTCKEEKVQVNDKTKIAFLADVHLHDIYASFSDTDYKGVKNPSTGLYNNVRTMSAQLHSTRLFNENYFAFIAALEDVVNRGIKIVALPGDFSDDGQPINVRALRKILDTYSKKHDITFLTITGNHDPVRPFTKDAGKKDFLGKGGKPQPIFSAKGMYSANGLPTVVTEGIKEWGYAEILNELSEYGFFPSKKFKYWETPFSNYTYENYAIDKAIKSSNLNQRQYDISKDLTVPDVSYLVEPIEGIWLLALDANVYVPLKEADRISTNPQNYNGASIGYNNVLTHKTHLIEWTKKIVKEAQKRGKTLIAFSHYPMVDFNDRASVLKKAVFGENKMQLHRVPKESVAQIFADAGVKLHIGGHMHINDTGIHKTEKGNVLVNVQCPSLAAYPAGYKIITVKPNHILEVETVQLKSVANFQELFPLYEMEHNNLLQENHEVWDKEILKTNSYLEYVNWHLKELVRLRFLPSDWPEPLSELILKENGRSLLKKATQGVSNLHIVKELENNNLSIKDFEEWNGYDFIFDFYRLQNGDHLSLKDIGNKRIKQYKILINYLTKIENSSINNVLREFAKIFQIHFTGAPSNHFKIDLKNGVVTAIKND